jgi:lipid II:glycine glycyltransferase (peptidoglycan interpeptide bridge formation enzyme)
MTAMMPTTAAQPSLDRLRTEDAAWDAFVETSETPFPLQLTPWATAKAGTGWSAERVVVDGGSGPIGGQVLIRRLGPGPLAFGYIPRGPVATVFDRPSVAAFTIAVRDLARSHRLVHVTIDPGLEGVEPERLLVEAGWRPSDAVQPQTTQLIDLRPDEAALWSDVYKSTRRYVNGARRQGCTVREGTEADLPVFFDILVETATRSGFIHRSIDSYRDVYRAFAASGRARILIGSLPDGTPVSSKMLLFSGPRAAQLYGGLSDAGTTARSGHFFEWEAIVRSKAAGATVFDMWGRSTAGIAHFKQGFGGRPVDYCGTFDLVTMPLARAAFLAARRGFVRVARRRRGLDPGASAGSDGG